MTELGRLLTAMVTPFNERGEVDYEQAQKLARALIESGSDGVVVVGTTGESPTLIREEEVRLFAEVKSAIGDKGTIVAGTGSNSTAEAIATTKEAERIGVDACLLVVPYYNRPSQEGIYRHFRTVAESTSLPCILYNVPARTVVSISAETTIKLSEIDNIVGTKEASGNLDQISRIIDGTGDSFLVYSGNDNDTLPILSLGGYGVISVSSHLVGRQMQEMITNVVEGRMDRAAQIHRSLLPLFSAMSVVSNPVPIKYALNRVGFRVGDTRLPLTPPDESSAKIIEKALSSLQIDLPLD
ncbi:MAG: 4-hydroxy-tetrahydrodipicolinate synthase [Dehalococcoidia bacterium]|nr:MAG: 4-hydroxy-tetrahydrodipicolinate synthase [Dehalococcoidia bacterium]